MIVIETERLILREFIHDDAPFILKLLNTPGWLKYIGNRNMKTLDVAGEYIQNVLINSYKMNGYGLYLVEMKETGLPAGMCGLVKRDYLEDTDLGFALLPEYEGKGIAYESALATIAYAKETLGIKSLLAITVKENTSSIKLLEKLEFKLEKIITSDGKDEELMLFKKNV